MITENELLPLLTGKRVIVSECQAREHGDNSGCLCALKGTVQVVGKMRESIFVGTPTWFLENTDKTARLAELTLVKDAPAPSSPVEK